MRMRVLPAILVCFPLGSGTAFAPPQQMPPEGSDWQPREPMVLTGEAPTEQRKREMVERAVEYLLGLQRENGMWDPDLVGGGLHALAEGIENPIVMTGLVGWALHRHREVDPERIDAAVRRGVDYIVSATDGRSRFVRKYTLWTNIYALHFLSAITRDGGVPGHTPEGLVRLMAPYRDAMLGLQTTTGGWEYGEEMGDVMTFATAAAVHALMDAEEAGLDVPHASIVKGIRRMKSVQNPNGVYIYKADFNIRTRQIDDDIRASMGRIGVCESAVYLTGFGDRETLEAAIAVFFEHRGEVDKVRGFPGTHRTDLYDNAAYYFLFGHFYTARALNAVSPEVRERWRPYFWEVYDRVQEGDGTWTDHPAMGKMSGTALGLLGIAELLETEEGSGGE